MYQVEIYSNNNFVGPTFWVGSDEKYKSLREAIDAAKSWAKENGLNDDAYKVHWRIVGCL